MNFWKRYLNVRKKAEEMGQTREKREREKDKSYELGIFGATLDFNIFNNGT